MILMDKSKKVNFVTKADLSQIAYLSNALYSKIKSVAPVYCVNFGMSNSSCNSRQEMENFPLWQYFRANFVNCYLWLRSAREV